MGGESELLDAMGGKAWVRSVGADLEVRASAKLVRLVLPGGRSRCGADRAVVHRRTEADGGGYAVEWWRVSGGEAEVVGEVEVRTPARAAEAVADDLLAQG